MSCTFGGPTKIEVEERIASILSQNTPAGLTEGSQRSIYSVKPSEFEKLHCHWKLRIKPQSLLEAFA